VASTQHSAATTTILLPPNGANGEALSTSTLQLLDQNGPNKEESKSALHNWKDISTSNIDDALQSLHDSSIIAELECSNDEAVVVSNDVMESNGAMNILLVPWWNDESSLSSTWNWRNHCYAASQSIERWRRYTADPLADVAIASLVALEDERAHEQALYEQLKRELSNWNIFPSHGDHALSSNVSDDETVGNDMTLSLHYYLATIIDRKVDDTEYGESSNIDAVLLPSGSATMNGHKEDDDDGFDAEFGEFQSATAAPTADHYMASSSSSTTSYQYLE
jgi:hypothetical protein